MAASTIPILDLLIFDSHDSKLLVVGDSSFYPVGWTIVSATLEITVPGYPARQIPFDPKNINVFNSDTLNLTCDVGTCGQIELPDGVYIIKYAVAPAYKYNVTKTFIRVDKIYKKFDERFLNLEMFNCDSQKKRSVSLVVNDIENYIQGAIAAANRCATKQAIEFYRKADSLLSTL